MKEVKNYIDANTICIILNHERYQGSCVVQ